MKLLITADTHFGHRKLVEDLSERPPDYEQRIIRNWQRMVQPDDLVIHLGDVFVGKLSAWTSNVPLLPGRKVLVLGNHDNKTLKWYMENGMEFCCSRFRWDIFGLKIVFSHEPVYDGSFDLNIHGHLHTGRHREYDKDDRHHLIALEMTSYQPRTLESVVKEWRKSLKAGLPQSV